MIEPQTLLNIVIKPACLALELHFNEPAFNNVGSWAQMLRTAATESDLRHRAQQGGGPAKSWFQVEPATGRLVGSWLARQCDDRWRELLAVGNYKLGDLPPVQQLAEISDRLEDSPFFAAMVARILYWSIPKRLPPALDIEAQAHYWKNHYNTQHGKGTVEDFLVAHQAHLADFERRLGWIGAVPRP